MYKIEELEPQYGMNIQCSVRNSDETLISFNGKGRYAGSGFVEYGAMQLDIIEWQPLEEFIEFEGLPYTVAFPHTIWLNDKKLTIYKALFETKKKYIAK